MIFFFIFYILLKYAWIWLKRSENDHLMVLMELQRTLSSKWSNSKKLIHGKKHVYQQEQLVTNEKNVNKETINNPFL